MDDQSSDRVEPKVSFASVLTKQHVENWGDKFDLDSIVLLPELLLAAFEEPVFHILEARDDDTILVLLVQAMGWTRAREVALASDGHLFS